ncbi:hypothetical protein L1987_30257 [Smallanthus sonchifolius]|uniref:Uncharacterized protein n=1 Tax=Smallanthus sonchifolius TaxID=185202 RepID=A0ACB9I304_9ASTR|nr:hypothetical protein L1987_30257 [Smallanthus sonchifolius]
MMLMGETEFRQRLSFKGWLPSRRMWEIIMSFDTITQVAPFDSLPYQEYVFRLESQILDKTTTGDAWYTLLRALFKIGASGELLRKDLNILSKLLSWIAQFNVIPRLGDKVKLLHYEIQIESDEGNDDEEKEDDNDATGGDGGARGRVYEDD